MRTKKKEKKIQKCPKRWNRPMPEVSFCPSNAFLICSDVFKPPAVSPMFAEKS